MELQKTWYWADGSSEESTPNAHGHDAKVVEIFTTHGWMGIAEVTITDNDGDTRVYTPKPVELDDNGSAIEDIDFAEASEIAVSERAHVTVTEREYDSNGFCIKETVTESWS